MTNPLVDEIRALDDVLAARIKSVCEEHSQRKQELLGALLAELGSVAACCRELGISRARWYQISGRLPSPYDFSAAAHLFKKKV